MITVTIPVERVLHGETFDFDVKATFAYFPPHRGAREPGTGLALEPDDPAELAFNSAVDAKTGEPIDLTPEEEEEAEVLAWVCVAEERQAAAEARADAWEDR